MLTPCIVSKETKNRAVDISKRRFLTVVDQGVEKVEVRGFEPLTPCMPSARDPFIGVQIYPN